MKKLAFAVALMLSSTTQAQTLEMPNSAGGSIVLTNRQGGCEGKDERFAYTTNPRGGLIPGCWWLVDERVAIEWEGGEIRIFETAAFTYKPGSKKQEKPAKSEKQSQSM